MSKSNGQSNTPKLSPAELAALNAGHNATDDILSTAAKRARTVVRKAVTEHLATVEQIIAGRVLAHPALARTVDATEARPSQAATDTAQTASTSARS